MMKKSYIIVTLIIILTAITLSKAEAHDLSKSKLELVEKTAPTHLDAPMLLSKTEK